MQALELFALVFLIVTNQCVIITGMNLIFLPVKDFKRREAVNKTGTINI